MSVQAISWAYSREDVTDPIERFVLVTLANYSDDYGVCWPSQATLVADCGCSERKVRNCLSALEDKGILIRFTRRRPNGSYSSSAFLLAGFKSRKIPKNSDEHPALAALSVVGKLAVDTIHRHHVPEAATGTTCRSHRHHVPVPPAPRAPLEPKEDPKEEPYPLTPTTADADRASLPPMSEVADGPEDGSPKTEDLRPDQRGEFAMKMASALGGVPPPAQPAERLLRLAGWINSDGYCPPSAVTNTQRRELLAMGLVTEERLRARQIY